MISPFDIKKIIEDPTTFIGSATDIQEWMTGLVNTQKVTQTDTIQLRPAQVDSWKNMASDQIGLLLGPPGTGKTFTIAAMACGLLSAIQHSERPCRIFITGFTRNSIENVLEYIANFAKKYASLQLHIAYDASHTDNRLQMISEDDFASFYNDHKTSVFGGTIWTLYKLLYNKKYPNAPTNKSDRPLCVGLFDFVIIDEASQMQFSHGLLAMAGLKSNGRVLVCGDNNQLPPIFHTDLGVENNIAEQSIYDFLIKKQFPQQALNETFRLNLPLVSFPSTEYYNGNYFSAPPVQKRETPFIANWRINMPTWKQLLLDPKLPFVIILHDGPEGGKENPTEAKLVADLANELYNITSLPEDKFWTDDVAIISPHRKQNERIRSLLSHHPQTPMVETVDRFQGRERNCILYSLCVSDPEFAQSEATFLLSPNRLNVAITRAKSKLILFVHKNILNISLRKEEAINSLRGFRSLIFSTQEIGSITLQIENGAHIHADIRGRTFEDNMISSFREVIQDIRLHPEANIVKATPPTDTLNKHLDGVFKVIKEEIQKEDTKKNYKTLSEIEEQLQIRKIKYCFDDFIKLYLMGKIRLSSFRKTIQIELNYLEQRPHTLDTENARTTIVELLYANNNTLTYKDLQSKVLWINEHKEDILSLILADLDARGDISITPSNINFENQTIVLKNTSLFSKPVPPPKEQLTPEDYQILNAIENREVAWINFGIVEQWHTKEDIASLEYSKEIVSKAIPKLLAHGHLMVAGTTTPLYRTRMAEIARELRLIKQRFEYNSIDDSPFLTRALKILVKERNKPTRDKLISGVFASLKQQHQDLDVHTVCDKFSKAFLRSNMWGEKAKISGFQQRSWEKILDKWLNVSSTRNIVLTADTGAGKTEATCIPIMMGALIDKLKSVQANIQLGCQAILIYPRIRLANNQAQRLTKYLQLVHSEGLPLLTIGLQTGSVPKDWPCEQGVKNWEENNKDWKKINPKTFIFPFFKCPQCENTLELHVNQGIEDGVDKLLCTNNNCTWNFAGWVGCKKNLYKRPPALFLPTADSVHQWLQNIPKYIKYPTTYPGNIFGDIRFPPPKAILVDEIHLYSMTFGSQFAYTLRRAIYRLESNHPKQAIPLTIGMSATLSSPRKLWSELTGRKRQEIEHIVAMENEIEANPIGREYYYFIQPEIESKGKDIAGASSTIQNTMCLAHNMRRRTGKDGGYRSVVFMDSLDKVKRLAMDFTDAEENKKLSLLRIPNGTKQCCNQPTSCYRFQQGECWYFACNDRAQWASSGRYLPGKHLRVSEPISSQLTDNAENIIFNSDIVFATSSLEVGFDDPNMMMVYQHYAPTNLASFVQRKGRGGRGLDDRPITGITLSSFSPTDSWYFRYPERMLNSSFDVPINVRNFFVQRGQVLAFMFDLLAQQITKTQKTAHKNTGFKNKIQFSDAIRKVFGHNIFDILQADGVQEFWTSILELYPNLQNWFLDKDKNRYWRDEIAETCRFLADPISVPDLMIEIETGLPKNPYSIKKEDISFAFSEFAPGKVSYRWGSKGKAHWTPYQGTFAPMFTENTEYITQKINGVTHFPLSITRLFPENPKFVLRPKKIQIPIVGQNESGTWKSNYTYKNNTVSKQASSTSGISDKSDSTPLGTLLLNQQSNMIIPHHIPHTKNFVNGAIEIYRSSMQNPRSTGLQAIKVFWGSDVQLMVKTPQLSTFYKRTFFSNKDKNNHELYGYILDTEGISIPLDKTVIDSFVKQYIENISEEWSSYHNIRFFQYRMLEHSHEVQLNSYELNMLTQLIAACVKDPSHYKNLQELLFKRTSWNATEWKYLFEKIFTTRLTASSILSQKKIDALIESINSTSGNTLLECIKKQLEYVKRPEEFTKYIQSCLLHSLAIRLKHLVQKFGQGDARRLMIHAYLPIDYTHENHKISVVELGSFGDGTIRTFESNIEEAFHEWQEEGMLVCQNARTDQAIHRLFELQSTESWNMEQTKHSSFRNNFAQKLNLDPDKDLDIIQVCTRLLFHNIQLDNKTIRYCDLFQEIHQFTIQLQQETKRLPQNDELISLLVEKVLKNEDETPHLSNLYKTYCSIHTQNPFASSDANVSPTQRLINQIYQISGTLCVDGCQACLHLGSDIVPTVSANLITSRKLVQEFWKYQKKLNSTPTVSTQTELLNKSSLSSQDFYKIFSGKFYSLMNGLQHLPPHITIKIEPGGDVTDNFVIDNILFEKVVVGYYIAKIVTITKSIFLIPEDQPNCEKIAQTLSKNGDVLFISPTDSSEYILEQIEISK